MTICDIGKAPTAAAATGYKLNETLAWAAFPNDLTPCYVSVSWRKSDAVSEQIHSSAKRPFSTR